MANKERAVYTSIARLENPRLVDDYIKLGELESIEPDINELFLFTIKDKKYYGDFADKLKSQEMFFVQMILDTGGYTTSGTLVKGDQEYSLYCRDLTLFE